MADRTVKVTLRGDVGDFNRAMLGASATAKAFTRSLDTSTHGMQNFTQSALAIGPALVPIGAAAIPAVAGLANQLGFAAAGAGVAAVAFQGVGDALKATNDFAINPTDANLRKLQESMATLGPAGQQFVQFLQDLRPQMQELQNIAQAGLFPGIEASIDSLMSRAPQVERIFATISTTIGDLIAEGGANLADSRWNDFFNFLETQARPTLLELGRSMGNLVEGFANLWMAFQPLSSNFSASFLQMSRDFAAWTDQLSGTQGFQDFLAYIERVGPKAWEALGAIGNALLQLVQAAAPIGEVALPVITALADAFSAFANTPFGPALIGAAAGISAISRAVALYNVANGSALIGLLSGRGLGGIGAGLGAGLGRTAKEMQAVNAAAGPTAGSLGLVAQNAAKLQRGLKVGGQIALLGVAMSDLDDKMHLTNTVMGAMIGSVFPGWGTAIGAAIGLTVDFATATGSIGQAIQAADTAIGNSALSIQQKIAAVDATISQLEARRAQMTVASGESSARGDLDKLIADQLRKKKELVAVDQEQAFAEAGLSSAMAGASAAARDQTYALLQNIAAKNAEADAAAGAFDAETRWREALKAAKAQADTNNAGLKGNSDAVLKNRNLISQLRDAYNQLADSGTASAAKMKGMRQNFIEVAHAMGLSWPQARKLADELLHIPKKTTPKVDLDPSQFAAKHRNVVKKMQDIGRLNKKPTVGLNDKASGPISAIRRAIASLRNRTITITTRRRFVGGGGGGQGGGGSWADGGVNYEAFANGGKRENHVAQIAPAGLPYRVWAEPETKGEAYIPLAPEKRARSLDIWAEVGRHLGVQGFADGGMTRATPAPMVNVAAPTWDMREFEKAMTKALDGARFQLDKDNRTLQLATRRG